MSKRTRHIAGFTLVELLVVILIIGILVSLLIPAVYSVLRRTRTGAIGFDINSLETAFEAYKNKYTDYPPDFSDVIANSPQNFGQTVTYRHIRKIFPRITAAELNIVGTYIKVNELTPSEAVVFWLGGLSSTPTQPFTGNGGPLQNVGTQANPIWVMRTQERNQPIFTFKEERLFRRVNNNNQVIAESYIAKGTDTPFVYFDSRTYHFVYQDNNNNTVPGYAACPWTVPDDPSSQTIALPYKSDILNTSFPNSAQTDSILLDNLVYFESRDTFQIVSAGLDGLYGPIVNGNSPALIYQDANNNNVPLFTRFPSGKGFHPTVWVTNANTNVNPPLEGYLKGQEDNLTSFSEGKTIQDAQQQ